MTMYLFLLGMVSMGAAVAGLIFLRFWRKTRDRLFLSFAVALWLLALNWSLLALLDESEFKFAMYGLRLLAFGLILAGIVDKNWLPKGKSDSDAPQPPYPPTTRRS
jgi:hypothetical protein